MPNFQVCLDASVAVKLVVNEPDSDRAASLWRAWELDGVQPVAPSLLLFESISAVRRRVARRLLTPDAARTAVGRILAMPISLPAPEGIIDRAWTLAERFRRPTVYDSFYLAVAEILGVPFWTADGPLHRIVSGQLEWVHLLGEHSPEADR